MQDKNEKIKVSKVMILLGWVMILCVLLLAGCKYNGIVFFNETTSNAECEVHCNAAISQMKCLQGTAHWIQEIINETETFNCACGLMDCFQKVDNIKLYVEGISEVKVVS